jgi:serine/threonine-protein kinase
MFMDEARIASRVRHPNVVSIIDVVAEGGELLLVMDYIEGEALSKLIRAERSRNACIDLRVVSKVITDMLSGLHAAHQAKGDDGRQLGVVHRDISPQNVLVGSDGVSHLIDFGVAKAAGRIQTTREGQLKGKLAYMAPEQIFAGKVTSATDIYSASAVLWEAIVGRRLFTGTDANLMYSVLSGIVPAPGELVEGLPKGLDEIVLKGLEREPLKRFATAAEMAEAIEEIIPPASCREVAKWTQKVAAEALQSRSRLLSELESISGKNLALPGAKSDLSPITPVLPLPLASEARSQVVSEQVAMPVEPSSKSAAEGAESGSLASMQGPLVTGNGKPTRWKMLAVSLVSVFALGSFALLWAGRQAKTAERSVQLGSAAQVVSAPLSVQPIVADSAKPAESTVASASTSASVASSPAVSTKPSTGPKVPAGGPAISRSERQNKYGW